MEWIQSSQMDSQQRSGLLFNNINIKRRINIKKANKRYRCVYSSWFGWVMKNDKMTFYYAHSKWGIKINCNSFQKPNKHFTVLIIKQFHCSQAFEFRILMGFDVRFSLLPFQRCKRKKECGPPKQAAMWRIWHST